MIANNYAIHIILLSINIFLCSFVVCAQSSQQMDKLKSLNTELNEYKAAGEMLKAAQTMVKMARIYADSRHHNNAIDFYNKAAKIYSDEKKYGDAGRCYSNMAFVYTDKEDYDAAKKYFMIASKAANLNNDQPGRVASMTDAAYVQTSAGRYANSNETLFQALEIAQKINNQSLIQKCMAMIANNYKAMGNTAKFQEFLKKSSELSAHIKTEDTKSEVADLKMQSEVDHAKAELERQNHEMVLRLNQLEALERQRQIDEQKRSLEQKNLDLEKLELVSKQRKDSLDNAEKLREIEQREKVIAQKETKQARNVLFVGFIFILLLVALMISLAVSSRKRKKLNDALQEKNETIEQQKKQVDEQAISLQNALEKVSAQKKDISDSIQYAKHIQTALMVSLETIQESIPQSFIFFRPKAIVSGDFYWFNHVEDFQNGQPIDRIFIAAADCTGHGVPGAMLSMIGHSMLDHIVTNVNVCHPNQVMENLHISIRVALRQETTDNHDGMDMAMCMIDRQNGVVEFAGAKNSMVYISPDGEMQKIPADKHGIGGVVTEETGIRIFKNSVVPIIKDKPATFYIFSDGFPDQFGGEKDRKYMTAKFRTLLAETSKKPLNEQPEILETELKRWKQDRPQTDDILIIGFRE